MDPLSMVHEIHDSKLIELRRAQARNRSPSEGTGMCGDRGNGVERESTRTSQT